MATEPTGSHYIAVVTLQSGISIVATLVHDDVLRLGDLWSVGLRDLAAGTGIVPIKMVSDRRMKLGIYLG